MAETPPTPLQNIRAQGLTARMYNAMLIVSPWSMMTKEQYDYVSLNVGEIIADLNAEATAAGNTNLCGYGVYYVTEVAANNYVSWYIPENMREAMGYQEASWREPINKAHGRPLGA
ncbi:hypothetical protein [Methylomonas rapida]|uniref:Uncharacterized protein n=1 Tax=Methylomonas rapida TaxID=2963939 RepID=A0ABY7GEK4_9GAMM|nr:hypothetical protein [Methylomonas rapida]WAR43722.1 hypothetical protein NM686_015225 [Methylomonas rapida]